MDAKSKAADSHFDNAKICQAYFAWAAKPLFEYIKQKQQYCPSRKDFFDKLRDTNYRDGAEVAVLEQYCAGYNMPIILLGHHKGVQYKLIPGNVLQEPSINWKDKRQMMPDNVLGINLHIEPMCVAAGRTSRLTHGLDSHGFHILHQIGSVMFYSGESSEGKGTTEGQGDRKWLETGFALVSDVTSGKAGAVYLVYNFYPYIPNLDGCSHIDNDYEWGFLPGEEEDEEQFSCAKIADSLDDLNEEYQFQWGKRYQYEVELVPAVQNPDGTLDRQIVDEPLEAAVPDLDEDTTSGYARTESKPATVSTPPSEKICDSSKLASRPGSVDGRTDSEDGNTYWPSPPRSQ